jgi:beta-aspartyl-peptidase (threonine type)
MARLAIHGGASQVPRDGSARPLGPYRDALRNALETGRAALLAGQPSLEVVETVIRILEDCPLFNAGCGSAFTAAGTHALDASLMCGRTLNAGAVAGATRVRNPIALARAVLDGSPHAIIAGAGADAFAMERGLETAPDAYFFTEERWQSLARAASAPRAEPDADHLGTVGAVARDLDGNLAAGTSTGGTTHQYPGRISDSAIIGAGTYADNRSCAVSTTGQGDFFIRASAAHRLSALVSPGGTRLRTAATRVLRTVRELGGVGGLIAVDHRGELALPFSTTAMYRAWFNGTRSFVRVF